MPRQTKFPRKLDGSAQRLATYVLHREGEERVPLRARASELRYISAELPQPIVLCNGAFDLLHTSHMRLLYAAKERAGTLVVALDADTKVRREKGAGRPILSFEERAAALAYMPVDLIVECGTRVDMDEIMRALRPRLRVAGAEYRDQASRYPRTPKLLVRMGGLHATDIIERVKERYL